MATGGDRMALFYEWEIKVKQVKTEEDDMQRGRRRQGQAKYLE